MISDRDLASIAKGLAPVLTAALAERDATIEALSARVAQLEARPALKYLGVWKDGTTYHRGDFVTYNGSVWHCNTDSTTSSIPGNERSEWTLAVKSGQDRR